MLKIESIDPDGTASSLQLLPGDQLLSMNGRSVDDILDYHLGVDCETLQIEVLRQDGEIWDLEVFKDAGDDLGLQVEHPAPNQCGNNCLFCFVHQLPKGMRPSLYIKDEDYRFSYLYGSYVTLSNIDQQDLNRIFDEQLSPLYVSVHCVDEELRNKMLGRKVQPILALLKKLTEKGIEIHTQIVLCPGLNDGIILEQTIKALAELSPGVRSLAVVPVGLTGHRTHLPDLQQLSRAEAQEALKRIHADQNQYLQELGSRFVFAADELYLQAGLDFPPLASYEELWQLENGVGLVAQFRQDGEEALREATQLELDEVTAVTGVSFGPELERYCQRLKNRTDVRIKVIPVANRYFGTPVSVCGLLTGGDILDRLKNQDLGQGVMIPDIALKDGESLFLDDVSVEDLEEQLNVPVVVIESSPWGLLDGMEDLAQSSVEIFRC